MEKLVIAAFGFLLLSCLKENPEYSSKMQGYKPVYLAYDQVRKIASVNSRKLQNPGKIYIKDKYLYINEIGEGIHIYDNSDKTKPKAISFISIPANQDISIKNNTLYADNGDDLVAIDITNPLDAKLLKRIGKAFPYPSFPKERGNFECADPKKGFVIRWEYTELENPKCYR